jgi:pimeloyl-ACP methyl ester carboxylesterase
MQRRNFQRDGVMLSHLGAGGSGSALVALHAHWMEGLTFPPLGLALAPEWRVIALDQRGHSDHAPYIYARGLHGRRGGSFRPPRPRRGRRSR